MMKKSMNFWRTVAGCLPFLMLASCADDNPVMQGAAADDKTRVLFAVDDFEPVGGSRTVTYPDGETYKVKWAEGDAVGIFPYEGYQQPFVIPAEQVDQSSATFDGGYWSLKEGLTYNAYYPFSDENFFSAEEGEALNIPVSYEGQSQDGSTYGVGAYDYTYSEWQTAPETGEVTFNFHHIGSLVIVHLTYPATAEFKSLALCAGSEELIPLQGTYDLTYNKAKEPEGEATYVKIPFVAADGSKAAALPLVLTNCNGTVGGSNTFYLMMPPVDLSNAAGMSFKLTDSNNTEYDMKVTPTNFESGKKYEFSIGLTTVSTFAVSGNPFGSGWNAETILSDGDPLGTANAGKTAWANGDQIVVKKTETGMDEQTVTLTYDGTTWTSSGNITILNMQDVTLTATYAPVATAGLGEYLTETCTVADDGSITVAFDENSRGYSRLRIVGEANTGYTVTTTGFTPAGAAEAATGAFTLTTDGEGNAYLYGTFAKDATVTVKQGDVIRVSYPFTAETEQGKSYALDARPVIDLSQYTEGATVDITGYSWIIGDGNEYNLSLNITADATVILKVGTSGVKLGGSITVADGKTLTLLVEDNAEHTVKGGISLGNGSNVIIEGDLTQENNKLTVTSSGGNAGIGANGGVTAGDITIRNARVDATGSSSSDSSLHYISGAGIGTANASMGNILIENSIVTAAGGYYYAGSSIVYDFFTHAAAIGMGSFGVTMGNITLIDSEIIASNNGGGFASVIGAGSCWHPSVGRGDVSSIGNMGNISITNTELNLSMANEQYISYAAMIGHGSAFEWHYVNMGKIIFTDVTQTKLDEMIATWSIPSNFNEWGAYVLGKGYYDGTTPDEDFGGVWVSDGNGGTVQIGDESGYYDPE